MISKYNAKIEMKFAGFGIYGRRYIDCKLKFMRKIVVEKW